MMKREDYDVIYSNVIYFKHHHPDCSVYLQDTASEIQILGFLFLVQIIKGMLLPWLLVTQSKPFFVLRYGKLCRAFSKHKLRS